MILREQSVKHIEAIAVSPLPVRMLHEAVERDLQHGVGVHCFVRSLAPNEAS
jgi:hypothetical protein